jgi:hypothetical protein
MADPTIIAACVIAILGAIGTFIGGLKIRKCINPVCEVDCKTSPPNSPKPSQDIK